MAVSDPPLQVDLTTSPPSLVSPPWAAWFRSLLSGLGTTVTSIFGFFPGTASVVSTGLRIYPNFTGTFTKLTAWTSVPATGNIVVSVLKNGGSTQTVTITAGNLTATATISLAMTSTDYLTAQLSATNASNVGFRIGSA